MPHSVIIVISLKFEAFLYTREIKEEPESFVINGKPLFGTFKGHPSRLDIRGVKRPYGIIPLPTFITNLRIKSKITFHLSLGDFIGYVSFLDAKILGYAEVCLWNTQTRQKFFYRSVMGPRKRFVPHDLNTAASSCYRKKRYIRISWDRKHDKLSVVFNLHGGSMYPTVNAALLVHFSSPETAEITSVTPFPTARRATALYSLTSKLQGSIALHPKHAQQRIIDSTDGCCLWNINRSYAKFRFHGEYVIGLGTLKGKKVAFRIDASNHDSVDTYKHNSNVLFYDGQVTPLPPVVITHPFGIMNHWVIQDTENMIDLTFTPISDNHNKNSVFVLRSDSHNIYGTFEGSLLTKDGEKLNFKSLNGIVKKYLFRL